MDTRTEIERIEEMLELSRHLGPGERYLMLYEGLPAITNRTGLAWWPSGDRRMIAILDAADCQGGLTPRLREQILRRTKRASGETASENRRCEHTAHTREPPHVARPP